MAGARATYYRRYMGAKDRKKPLSAEQKADCRAFAAVFRDQQRRRKDAPLASPLTQESLGADVGVTQGAIGNMLKARLAISPLMLTKLAKALGMPPGMIAPNLHRQLFGKPASNEDDWVEIRHAKQAVAAGHGSVADENVEISKLMFRRQSLRKKGLNPDKVDVHDASGDSMLERIHHGDVLLFDRSDTRVVNPRNGQKPKIFVCLWDDHLIVKRLTKTPDGKYVVSSDNKDDPKWREDRIADPSQGDFQILGRVRWIGSWED